MIVAPNLCVLCHSIATSSATMPAFITSILDVSGSGPVPNRDNKDVARSASVRNKSPTVSLRGLRCLALVARTTLHVGLV